MTAIQHSSLPSPPSNPFLNPLSSDFAAFSALNPSHWLQDIEPEADCEFFDYMPLTILIVEFSDTVLIGSLYHFMRERFYTRMVYFVDSVDIERFDSMDGDSDTIREDMQKYLERGMTRRLVDLIDDHKAEYWFSDIFKLDPLNIVIMENRASDPIFQKAVGVAITDVLDGEWKMATEGKEKKRYYGEETERFESGR
ncbi:uncharacterized protein Bfra_001278ia [Botrytis fragariae]|uniref:Uncharacterized protein n=1 Tax=Botrytis fragariae TaxID=1964551 RepID=A0A8H6B0J2_9HELO|nr:uncharacterized protein Bfra_001278ia [Botrytis fragariae]KAF5876920.1 hypothetical protein Bfra_001278ia [Botrytis fragariae]